MPQLNLTLAWAWILLGFVGGMILGLRFQDEHWLGGYSSWPRRLYRLGHISCFGLAMVNLFFYFTAAHIDRSAAAFPIASAAFALGAVLMPVCCVVAARHPAARLTFALPVSCLLTGAVLTLILVLPL